MDGQDKVSLFANAKSSSTETDGGRTGKYTSIIHTSKNGFDVTFAFQ
jgi:hypothetical protein